MDRREFRGKRVDNGEWIYGFYVELGGEHLICRTRPSQSPPVVWHIMKGYFTPVDSETVGQYTGLCDRDGSEIWEGDMLETDLKRPCLVVVYRNAQFALECVDDHKYFDTMAFADWDETDMIKRQNWWKIIGNIHDNPELLEVRG